MTLNRENQNYLREKFQTRLTFVPLERKLYGHDIAAIPNLVKPLIGNTTPDAVVQPETEEELIELVNWARMKKIPLTPRGKSTSGYGGVIPVKKGIVVDFYRMKGVLNVDKDKLTATVQPGISWEQLDRKLEANLTDTAALSYKLPLIDRRRMAGSGWSRHRKLRIRLFREKRIISQAGTTHW